MTALTIADSIIIEERDPIAVGDLIDEGFKWASWLAGDTIPNVPANSLWAIYKCLDDGTFEEAAADFDIITKTITGTITTAVWVTPLAAAGGNKYAFLNTITTAGTRKKTLGFYVPVAELP